MAAAVRQTEERVAEVRRRAEDAVNQVGNDFHIVQIYYKYIWTMYIQFINILGHKHTF